MSEEPERLHGKPDEPEGSRASEESRALVPIGAEHGPRPDTLARPLATFIAQLMACDARVPDFREHRRAEPGAATARYAAVGALTEPRSNEFIL